jgi:hypothetical protein
MRVHVCANVATIAPANAVRTAPLLAAATSVLKRTTRTATTRSACETAVFAIVSSAIVRQRRASGWQCRARRARRQRRRPSRRRRRRRHQCRRCRRPAHRKQAPHLASRLTSRAIASCESGFGPIGSAKWCACCGNDCFGSQQACIDNDGFCSTRCMDQPACPDPICDVMLQCDKVCRRRRRRRRCRSLARFRAVCLSRLIIVISSPTTTAAATIRRI